MLWQQGVKLGRAQSQQPLDTATLQDTLRELTGTHDDMERWVRWDIHRDIQIHKATCSCSQKHKDARHSGSHVGTKGSRTHTDKYSSRYTGLYGHRHTSWGVVPEETQDPGHTNGHTDTPSSRHTGTKMANHTLSYTMTIILRATCTQE